MMKSVYKRFRFDRFEIDEARHCLIKDNKVVPEGELGTAAFKVLLKLVKERLKDVTFQDLIREGWPNPDPRKRINSGNVHKAISDIYKVLEEKDKYIKDIRGVGYRFIYQDVAEIPSENSSSTPSEIPEAPNFARSVEIPVAETVQPAAIPVIDLPQLSKPEIVKPTAPDIEASLDSSRIDVKRRLDAPTIRSHLLAVPTPAWIVAVSVIAFLVAWLAYKRLGFYQGQPVEANCCIYLTKLINPPTFRDARRPQVFNPKSIAWLAVKGDTSYIVSSITIRHLGQPKPVKDSRPGIDIDPIEPPTTSSGCEPIELTTASPTDNYRFGFTANSEETHALKPPLELKGGNNLGFTFVLEPVGFSPTVCDRLTVSIHYHSLNGDKGQLILDESPDRARLLSRLIGRNVESDGFVVTPEGWQRGNGDNTRNSTFVRYKPYRFLPISLDELEVSQIPPSIALANERIELNEVIKQEGGLVKLMAQLRPEELHADMMMLLLDLCSGLPGADGQDALNEIVNFYKSFGVEEEDFPADFGRTLAIRHLLEPNESLANAIIKSKGTLNQFGDEACVALAVYPRGEWAAALISMSGDFNLALQALYFRRHDLTPSDREKVHTIAWKSAPEAFNSSGLATPFYSALSIPRGDFTPRVAIKYLASYGHSIESLEKLIAEKHPSLPKAKIRIGLERILGVRNELENILPTNLSTTNGRPYRGGRYRSPWQTKRP